MLSRKKLLSLLGDLSIQVLVAAELTQQKAIKTKQLILTACSGSVLDIGKEELRNALCVSKVF